jgi:transcriptional regulator with XRE-family HTH domain
MTEARPGGSPTVLRMILGRQFQALREKAGLSYDQAAEAIYSSSYTIRRMERAEGGLKPLTVKSLLMAC